MSGFTFLLRAWGVDADLDLFHGHEPTDWARFGPTAIRTSDYVLVAVSPTWRQAWDAELAPGKLAGARGEADALRGLYKQSAHEFLTKVIPVILPGASEADIPTELHATIHWCRVPTLDDAGIEDVYRRLTGQAKCPKPPLGKLRRLDPDPAPIGRELSRADQALAQMPESSGGSRDAPIDQARQSVEARRAALLRELSELSPAQPEALPKFEPHRHWSSGTFNLHMPNGPLHVHLINDGGSEAEVLSASLDTGFGHFEGRMYVNESPPLAPESAASVDVPRDAHLVIAFGEGALADLTHSAEPLLLRLRYRAAGRAQTYEYRLKLHRAGASPGATPQWRAKKPVVIVVD